MYVCVCVCVSTFVHVCVHACLTVVLVCVWLRCDKKKSSLSFPIVCYIGLFSLGPSITSLATTAQDQLINNSHEPSQSHQHVSNTTLVVNDQSGRLHKQLWTTVPAWKPIRSSLLATGVKNPPPPKKTMLKWSTSFNSSDQDLLDINGRQTAH